MVLIDSSVWIAWLHERQTVGTRKLRELATRERLLLGDLILLEVLQGARDERHAERIERGLRRYEIATLLDGDLAVVAAQNFRVLRGLGITVRKTADLIIGTYCIEHGHVLLHEDRDFDPMEKHLGLRVA